MSARTGNLGASLVAIVLLAGCGGGSSAGQQMSYRLQHDILTEAAAQLKAHDPTLSPAATVTIVDANCTETGSTQMYLYRYVCLTRFRINDPSKGINNQGYFLNINATCFRNGLHCTFTFGKGK